MSKYCYTLKGKNRRTNIYEYWCVNAGLIEDAIPQMEVTHDEIEFIRVDKLGAGW